MKIAEIKKIIREEISSLLKEDIFQDYANDFQFAAAKQLRGKKLLMWEFELDRMAGTFEFEKGNYLLYATPFWDGTKGIPISVMDKEGNEILQDTIKMQPTYDLRKDYFTYIKLLKDYIRKLEKQLK